MAEEMFNKYRRQDNKERILLLYLILNKYDLDKVECAVETVQNKMFGVELRKIYGVTSEFVDVQRIEAELAEIHTPVICSMQSYELYSNTEVIHTYMPKEFNKPLYINDMGVISQLMVITEQCVVSSNLAEPVESAKDIGFMYFVDYVLHGECKIGAWEISYKDKEFSVFYTSKGSDEQMHKELLYRALELDQTSTFKLVLYIIKKAAESIEEVLPDNFTEETWKLEKNQ